MRKLAFVIGVFVLMVLVSVSVSAQEATELYITGAWARATVAAPGMGGMMEATAEATPEMRMGHMGSADGVSAAYMMIENPGSLPVRLVSAATKAAELVEIHEIVMENEVMKMRPLESGLEIPAGGSVELKPGGYHVMLMELTQAFVPGKAISLTLTFDLLKADGTTSGTTQDVVIGVPILAEMPMATPNDLVFINAWARPTAAAMMAEATPEATPAMGGMGHMGGAGGVSAAYMQILNRGAADRLVSASTDAATLVEIHEIVMENEVMKMRPLENGLELPSGERVMLKPGGYHIMLMELTQALVPGDAIALTLTFESGTEVQLGVPIYDAMGME